MDWFAIISGIISGILIVGMVKVVVGVQGHWYDEIVGPPPIPPQIVKDELVKPQYQNYPEPGATTDAWVSDRTDPVRFENPLISDAAYLKAKNDVEWNVVWH